ncbi:hypothetical protein PVAP13_1KG522300 [Panicum virgatum]|uniref:Uncharacterized protein n=1 Tax=Panicum virgatum TaxID=38727 RepID=A0A8T0XRJ2_PANVG|nr:hypothetical protein PVAP13_1KG522300 [Panicum virgatum]
MHTHLINLTEGLSLVPWHQLQGCHFNQHRHHHDLLDHNSYMMPDLLRITLRRQQKERKDRTTSFLIWVILRIHHHQCIGPTQDIFEANFEYWSRLFSTPNQQADPTFQTPMATGRPGRDVGPLERHTYSTDHVHAQRKRGRHGRGGRGG